jgi:hypothetical protein
MTPARACPAVLLALAAVLPAGGCGGGDVTRVNGRTVPLRLDEYRILPRRVEAPAGRLRLVARDDGVLAHRLAVGRGRYAAALGRPIDHGQRSTLVVTLPPGRYRLFCSLSDHDTLGMTAQLEVF